jgi:hypothetical protein
MTSSPKTWQFVSGPTRYVTVIPCRPHTVLLRAYRYTTPLTVSSLRFGETINFFFWNYCLLSFWTRTKIQYSVWFWCTITTVSNTSKTLMSIDVLETNVQTFCGESTKVFLSDYLPGFRVCVLTFLNTFICTRSPGSCWYMSHAYICEQKRMGILWTCVCTQETKRDLRRKSFFWTRLTTSTSSVSRMPKDIRFVRVWLW